MFNTGFSNYALGYRYLPRTSRKMTCITYSGYRGKKDEERVCREKKNGILLPGFAKMKCQLADMHTQNCPAETLAIPAKKRGRAIHEIIY